MVRTPVSFQPPKQLTADLHRAQSVAWSQSPSEQPRVEFPFGGHERGGRDAKNCITHNRMSISRSTF